MPHSSSDDKPYRVARVSSGLGLIATKTIKKGMPIIFYEGRLLDCRKKEDDSVNNKYLFEIDKRWTIDGSVRENLARYINHGCKPNAEPTVMPRKRKILISAKRTIRAGEEINYNYGKPYFETYLKPKGCRCAACVAKNKKRKSRENFIST